MIGTKWQGLALVAVLAVGLAAAAGCNESAKRVPLPTAAADAVLKAFPGAKVGAAEREVEDGVEVFEVEFGEGAAETEVEVTADGTIVSVETEIAMKDVPEAAAAAITKAAEGATIEEVTKEEIRAEVRKDDKGVARLVVLDTPKIVYEAELVKGDQEGEIAVAADGSVLEPLRWKPKGKDDDEGAKGAAADKDCPAEMQK